MPVSGVALGKPLLMSGRAVTGPGLGICIVDRMRSQTSPGFFTLLCLTGCKRVFLLFARKVDTCWSVWIAVSAEASSDCINNSGLSDSVKARINNRIFQWLYAVLPTLVVVDS